eukprot:CAMPEP_0170568708 /NCGR_PEP_ID=MMETSP0224-20130122/106_1 /TAXON_ID=285029 /ORGANISM="Togula jolla, Strain CCCM 725" /LENGTH=48 /DNA_ID= /DNA_START= /DNA_END= /DNA_ORIENTATION=
MRIGEEGEDLAMFNLPQLAQHSSSVLPHFALSIPAQLLQASSQERLTA